MDNYAESPPMAYRAGCAYIFFSDLLPYKQANRFHAMFTVCNLSLRVPGQKLSEVKCTVCYTKEIIENILIQMMHNGKRYDHNINVLYAKCEERFCIVVISCLQNF